MGKTFFSDLDTREIRLLALAALGPTGVRRPVAEIRQRLNEEKQGLVMATAARDIIGAVEKAGDLAYYGLLLAVNQENLKEYRRLVREAAGQVNKAFQLQPSLTTMRLLIAAIAKYETRFVVNRQREDAVAERQAIARKIPHWLAPRNYGHVFSVHSRSMFVDEVARCKKCGAEWHFYHFPNVVNWYPLNEAALYPCGHHGGEEHAE